MATVDGRNPKQPPGMYKTVEILGYLLIATTGAGFPPSTVFLSVFVPVDRTSMRKIVLRNRLIRYLTHTIHGTGIFTYMNG